MAIALEEAAAKLPVLKLLLRRAFGTPRRGAAGCGE
jgi:hypothetical protein